MADVGGAAALTGVHRIAGQADTHGMTTTPPAAPVRINPDLFEKQKRKRGGDVQDLQVTKSQALYKRMRPMVAAAIESMGEPALGSDLPRSRMEGDLITCNRHALATVVARLVAAELTAQSINAPSRRV